jgi:hypothetical protein
VTVYVPAELVDAVLAEHGGLQVRLRRSWPSSSLHCGIKDVTESQPRRRSGV